ncbi:MAG: hypothetical protein ACKOB8_07585 [Mycobacterium sp.]
MSTEPFTVGDGVDGEAGPRSVFAPQAVAAVAAIAVSASAPNASPIRSVICNLMVGSLEFSVLAAPTLPAPNAVSSPV